MLTINDVAKELKVSKKTVYRMIVNGKLKATRVTGKRMFRVREEDFEQFRKELK